MELQTNTDTSTHYPQDLSSFTGNWIWKAVMCLVESPDFQPSPKWTASRLNISIENAVDALDGLERLNLIRRDGSSYIVTEQSLQISDKDISPARLAADTSLLMQQAVSKITSEDKFTIQFFLGNKALVSEYAPKFMALYSDMEKAAHDRNLTDVVLSQISFSVITDNKGGVQ